MCISAKLEVATGIPVLPVFFLPPKAAELEASAPATPLCCFSTAASDKPFNLLAPQVLQVVAEHSVKAATAKVQSSFYTSLLLPRRNSLSGAAHAPIRLS